MTSRRPAEPTVAKAPTPVDMGRRRFFRAFAGELINTAATVAGAAQALQQASAEAASVILNPEGAARLLGPPGDDASGTPGAAVGGDRPERVPDAVPRGCRHPLPHRPAPSPGRPRRVPVPVGRGGGLRDPRDDRARRAGDRPGRRDRARDERRVAGGWPALRPQGDVARRSERADQRPAHGGQPALGGRARPGPLYRARRAVGGRLRDRAGDARGSRRDRLRGHHRPRPPGGLRAGDPADRRTTARSASSPIATPDPWPAASTGPRWASSRPPTMPIGRSTSGSTRPGRTSRAPG